MILYTYYNFASLPNSLLSWKVWSVNCISKSMPFERGSYSKLQNSEKVIIKTVISSGYYLKKTNIFCLEYSIFAPKTITLSTLIFTGLDFDSTNLKVSSSITLNRSIKKLAWHKRTKVTTNQKTTIRAPPDNWYLDTRALCRFYNWTWTSWSSRAASKIVLCIVIEL